MSWPNKLFFLGMSSVLYANGRKAYSVAKAGG